MIIEQRVWDELQFAAVTFAICFTAPLALVFVLWLLTFITDSKYRD